MEPEPSYDAVLASSMDLDPLVDPVTCLAMQFDQMAQPKNEQIEKRVRETLKDKRTIPTAYPDTLTGVAHHVGTYIGGGQWENIEKNKQTSGRIKTIVTLLTREENLKLENARILVAIIKEILDWFGFDNHQLAHEFKQEIVIGWALATFKRLWDDSTCLETQFTPGSDVELEKLRFFSAIIADLYSEELIEWVYLHDCILFALSSIFGPVLFNVFLYDIMSRALMGRGFKIPATVWAYIMETWNTLQEIYERDDVTGAVVNLFFNDATRMGRGRIYCGIEWSRPTTAFADAACWKMVDKLISGTLKDEEEEMEMAGADSELAGAMNKVRLECEVDGLAEAFGQWR